MRGIRTFVTCVAFVEVAALIGLLLAGAALTWVEDGYRYSGTFFTYRIHNLDNLPAWFAAAMALMAINGFWVFRLGSIEGSIQAMGNQGPGREWEATLPINPLRLFAINLVAIPGLLALFMLIRANHW